VFLSVRAGIDCWTAMITYTVFLYWRKDGFEGGEALLPGVDRQKPTDARDFMNGISEWL